MLVELSLTQPLENPVMSLNITFGSERVHLRKFQLKNLYGKLVLVVVLQSEGCYYNSTRPLLSP